MDSVGGWLTEESAIGKGTTSTLGLYLSEPALQSSLRQFARLFQGTGLNRRVLSFEAKTPAVGITPNTGSACPHSSIGRKKRGLLPIFPCSQPVPCTVYRKSLVLCGKGKRQLRLIALCSVCIAWAPMALLAAAEGVVGPTLSSSWTLMAVSFLRCAVGGPVNLSSTFAVQISLVSRGPGCAVPNLSK